MKLSIKELEEKFLACLIGESREPLYPLLKLLKLEDLKRIIKFIHLLGSINLQNVIDEESRILKLIPILSAQDCFENAVVHSEFIEELKKLLLALKHLNERNYAKATHLIKRISKNYLRLCETLQKALTDYLDKSEYFDNGSKIVEYNKFLEKIDLKSIVELINQFLEVENKIVDDGSGLFVPIDNEPIIDKDHEVFNSLTIEDVPIIADLLNVIYKDQSTQVISEFYNCIKSKGVLDLSCLEINDADLKIILEEIESLDKDHTIRFISFANNHISNDGVAFLVKSWVPMLDLSNNNIDDFGALELSKHTEIRVLRIKDNPLMPKVIPLISNLLNLNFNHYQIRGIYLINNLLVQDYQFPNVLTKLVFSYLDNFSSREILDSDLVQAGFTPKRELALKKSNYYKHKKENYKWKHWTYTGMHPVLVIIGIVLLWSSWKIKQWRLVEGPRSYYATEHYEYYSYVCLGFGLMLTYGVLGSMLTNRFKPTPPSLDRELQNGTILPLYLLNQRLEVFEKESINIRKKIDAELHFANNDSNIPITLRSKALPDDSADEGKHSKGLYFLKNLSSSKNGSSNNINQTQSSNNNSNASSSRPLSLVNLEEVNTHRRRTNTRRKIT